MKYVAQTTSLQKSSAILPCFFSDVQQALLLSSSTNYARLKINSKTVLNSVIYNECISHLTRCSFRKSLHWRDARPVLYRPRLVIRDMNSSYHSRFCQRVEITNNKWTLFLIEKGSYRDQGRGYLGHAIGQRWRTFLRVCAKTLLNH